MVPEERALIEFVMTGENKGSTGSRQENGDKVWAFGFSNKNDPQKENAARGMSHR